MLRLALEIVDAQGQGMCVLVPDEVHVRTLRVGYRGDVEVPLPGEITLRVKSGRVYVASVRHEVSATLGGMRLPTWPVPVPVPSSLAIGSAEIRIHALEERRPVRMTAAAPRRHRAPRSAPPVEAREPPYLADRVMLACVALVRRASRAIRAEWRVAPFGTKLAFATVIVATLVVACARGPAAP